MRRYEKILKYPVESVAVMLHMILNSGYDKFSEVCKELNIDTSKVSNPCPSISELIEYLDEEILGGNSPNSNTGWVKLNDGRVVCKRCGHEAATEGNYRPAETPYCPYCGTEMFDDL